MTNFFKTVIFAMALSGAPAVFGSDESVNLESLGLIDMKVTVNEFEVLGDNPLSLEETRAVLSNYLGKDLPLESLQRAQFDLAQRIREAGFNHYAVSASPQDITDGVVYIMVTKDESPKELRTEEELFEDSATMLNLPKLDDE